MFKRIFSHRLALTFVVLKALQYDMCGTEIRNKKRRLVQIWDQRYVSRICSIGGVIPRVTQYADHRWNVESIVAPIVGHWDGVTDKRATGMRASETRTTWERSAPSSPHGAWSNTECWSTSDERVLSGMSVGFSVWFKIRANCNISALADATGRDLTFVFQF